MPIRTFKYRLYPSPAQSQRMFQVLDVCRNWYNMCLAERKWAYKLEGRSVTKSQQEKSGIAYRKTFSQAQIVFSQTMQGVCDDVDRAFQAFFRRVKSGETPGYPRFKGRDRFLSFAFKQFGVGAKLDGRRLKLFGIGRVLVRWHRPIEGEIKTVRIVHKAGCWYACFACEVPEAEPLLVTGQVVGIDVGLTSLITTSDGRKTDNPTYYKAGQKKLRRLQRQFARAKRGSNNRRKKLRRVQKQQEYVANQRRDYLHKLSRQLVNEYDGVALEDLSVTKMVSNRRFSKSILDSGWSMFRQFLTYKAESAGRVIALVDPAYTSQTCSSCGEKFEGLTLRDRWVNCGGCGLSLGRDQNAALNILKRAGWDTSVEHNVSQWAERVQEAARL